MVKMSIDFTKSITKNENIFVRFLFTFKNKISACKKLPMMGPRIITVRDSCGLQFCPLCHPASICKRSWTKGKHIVCHLIDVTPTSHWITVSTVGRTTCAPVILQKSGAVWFSDKSPSWFHGFMEKISLELNHGCRLMTITTVREQYKKLICYTNTYTEPLFRGVVSDIWPHLHEKYFEITKKHALHICNMLQILSKNKWIACLFNKNVNAILNASKEILWGGFEHYKQAVLYKYAFIPLVSRNGISGSKMWCK